MFVLLHSFTLDFASSLPLLLQSSSRENLLRKLLSWTPNLTDVKKFTWKSKIYVLRPKKKKKEKCWLISLICLFPSGYFLLCWPKQGHISSNRCCRPTCFGWGKVIYFSFKTAIGPISPILIWRRFSPCYRSSTSLALDSFVSNQCSASGLFRSKYIVH